MLFQGGATFSDATLMPDESGSAARPIVFASYGAGRATLTGGVWFDGTHYATFRALAIRTAWQGINATGHGISVVDCDVSGVGIGLNVKGSSWVVEGNTLSRRSGVFMNLRNPAENNTTRANVFVGGTSEEMSAGLGDPLPDPPPPPPDVLDGFGNRGPTAAFDYAPAQPQVGQPVTWRVARGGRERCCPCIRAGGRECGTAAMSARAILAKAVVPNNAREIRCRVVAGADFDRALIHNNGGLSTEIVTLTVLHRSDTSFSARLQCYDNDSTTGWNLRDLKVTAIRVNRFSNLPG